MDFLLSVTLHTDVQPLIWFGTALAMTTLQERRRRKNRVEMQHSFSQSSVDLSVRCGMKPSTLYSLVAMVWHGTCLSRNQPRSDRGRDQSRRTVASENIIAATDVAYVVS